MALNAQLPNYFSQFDLTGGGLLDASANQSNPAVNPLAVQTQGQSASAGQSEISQLQSQISDLISGSAGQASAAALPSSISANTTPALTSTATLPDGLSTPATPGPVTTTTNASAPTVPGLGLSSTTGIGAVPATAINPGSTSASPSWALGPSDLTMEQIQASHGGSVPASGLQAQPGYDQNASRTPATLLSSLGTTTTPATPPPATTPAITGGSVSNPNDFTGWGSYNLQSPAHLNALQELGLTEQQAQSRFGNENALESSGFLQTPDSQAQQLENSNAQSSAYNQLLQMFPDQQQFIRDQMESGLNPDNLYAQLMTPGPTNQTGPRVGTYQPTHANQPGYHQLDGGRWVPNG
jgi:hypothetical protein